MADGELILYTTEDGEALIELYAQDGTVWLTQAELAELFQTTKQNISLHAKNILSEKELPLSVVKESLTTAADGKKYKTKFYNLSMILAVGYRVASLRGTQFRKWATVHLQEYLIKGFVLDDKRLKNPEKWDYFDELLERIREIRASEKRFYQKIRDIYATAVDYNPHSDQAQLFFKKVQNKMLWAITGHTAAELIYGRANPELPNMGLTNWQGPHVRKGDVTIAKNYLNEQEIQALNRIVTMYLDYAEDQTRQRKTTTMRQWEEKLEAFLSFNGRDILTHAGKVSAEIAEKLACDCYNEFDAKRRSVEKIDEDKKDMALLEKLGSQT
jgi:hypothetical protein